MPSLVGTRSRSYDVPRPMHEPGRAELLLERDRELESLRAALAEAVGGEGRLALVEGPAGIGKSRLLAELRGRARRRTMRVLAARGSELEREFPFGVVRQLFEPPSATRTPASAGSPAPPRPRGRSSRLPSSTPRPPARRDLRRAPRPLLAHGERRGGRAAAAVRRRPALVRPPVAALPRLPRPPARGHAGAGRRDAAEHRPGHRSRADRRDRPRPGTRAVRPGPSAPTAVARDGARAARRGRRRALLRRVRHA